MRRRNGIVAFVALSSFLLCGATSPNSCSNSNTNNDIPGTSLSEGQAIGIVVGAGAAIAVGTIVLVEVHKSHHTIKGCVTAGSDGIKVHNESDQKVYALTDITANVKVGDIVKVNGNKNKRQKDSAGDEEFAVAKVSKDYGPCKVALAAPVSAPASPAAQ
jgi:hypothetical protein